MWSLFLLLKPIRRFSVTLILVVVCVGAVSCAPKRAEKAPGSPRVEEYATMESITNGVPVWSFSNLAYLYGVSPDFMPGVVMQEGNRHPRVKIRPKKSWEIKSNYAGAESEMTRRNAYNDSQPMLPIHLIDGDPNTAWANFEMTAAKARAEWIRIDLPMEAEIASVALVTADYHNPHYGNYGKALPRELEVKTSRDALNWETVYSNKQVAQDQRLVEIKFKPRPAKQVWIIGNDFPKLTARGGFGIRYLFSIGEVEVRDPAGANLALVSRGGSVTVSSTSYVQLNDRFTQDALWNSLNYDLGNKWVRIGGDNGSFMWHYVEHEKGKLEIDPVGDQSVTELVQHGINVILTLDFKGNWIYEQPPRKTNWLEARFREINDAYTDPVLAADANSEMYQAYLRYIEYMVGHFKDRIAYFELGNEWNGWFGAEHYVPGFFEPTYKIVKQVWPDAKVMLGSPGEFDRNGILDCLGRQREYGIRGGKLLLNTGDAVRPGVVMRGDIEVKDVRVSVEAQNKGRSGILLRYKDPYNYLVALYAAPDHSIMFYEVAGEDKLWGPHWGKPLAAKKVQSFGTNIKLEAKVQTSSATLTISGGGQSASTTYTLQHVNDSGAVGLVQRTGDEPQLFGNFLALDAQGKTLAKDEFAGTDGAIPAGWKYITGGPNPIKPGLGPRIDAIAWHPGDEPDATYFSAVREFQKQCQSLGFKGRFFATEVYAGSMYPPGPQPGNRMMASETQMAKYFVKSLVGHSGLGMEAGPCHPHFTAFAHPQALCQTTWGMQTLHPCRPTMTYYMWRTIATVMDDFQPADFPVRFSDEKGLVYFTFQRGDNERMVGVWVDGPEKDGITQAKTDLTFPGVRAKQATVVDIMNGTEQGLDFAAMDAGTVLKGVLIKDYPVLIEIGQ